MYNVRKIEYDDYHKKHLELYKNLTIIEPETISKNDYINFIDHLSDNHMIFVISENESIIATITVIIEKKLSRSQKSVGHIEDVIVSDICRGKGIGKKIIDHVVDYCKSKNCYKVILDCSENNIIFYEKCGFFKKEIEMALYF